MFVRAYLRASTVEQDATQALPGDNARLALGKQRSRTQSIGPAMPDVPVVCSPSPTASLSQPNRHHRSIPPADARPRAQA